ncbi:LysR family transcriptional regulator [Bosea sp. (in: a-proteobacteria)]|jgi:DNA-binding transcriptional LysR family regulator|uniref:LysR family transcriptional regulator n=1 Tax=Bosea sp. (in: a-proteobacteria) TaxID=1871050 RepID=UPI0035624525
MRSFDHLDWDDLRVFIELARSGSLSQTARRLRVDHSTVSRRIAQLETVLGAGVFERSRIGFRLNDLGGRLLLHAETMESAVIAIRGELGGGEAAASGVVRLATMEGIASLYIAPRLRALREAAPELTLELVTSPQVIHVNRREADLFLSFFRPPGQGLVSEQIGSFGLGLYAAPAYLARMGTPETCQDLARHEFVTYIDDLIQVDAVRWLRDVVEEAPAVFHSNSMIAQLNAALGGMGLVLLPRFAIHEGSPLVPVLPREAKTTRDIWVNVHQDLQFTPRIKAVVAFLKRHIRADMAAGLL